MGKQYQIQCCIRNLVYAAVAAAVVFVIRRQWNLIGISDACALSGIVFLIVGLFRRARYMRFYDLCNYGARRLTSCSTNPGGTEKPFGSYGELVEKRRYERNYTESFIAAASMFICSLAILGI